jgi:toxin ParE1/3/4
MKRVVYSDVAKRDLTQSLFYIAEHSPAGAKRLLAKINRRIGQLAKDPELGPRRPEIDEDARSLVVDPFVILYAVTSDCVDIRRILHGNRNISSELFGKGRPK